MRAEWIGIAIALLASLTSVYMAVANTVQLNETRELNRIANTPRVFVTAGTGIDTSQVVFGVENQGLGPAIRLKLVYSIEPVWARIAGPDDEFPQGETIVEMNGEPIVMGLREAILVAGDLYDRQGGDWRSEYLALSWPGLQPGVASPQGTNVWATVASLEAFLSADHLLVPTPGYDVKAYHKRGFTLSAVALKWTVNYEDLVGRSYEESGVRTVAVLGGLARIAE